MQLESQDKPTPPANDNPNPYLTVESTLDYLSHWRQILLQQDWSNCTLSQYRRYKVALEKLEKAERMALDELQR